jgi:hypothetical protein
MKVEPTLSGSGGNTNDLSHLTVPVKKVDSVPSNPFFKKKLLAKEEVDPKANPDNEMNLDELDH